VPIGVASAILLIVRVGFADVQNILLALCFNGIGLPAAATGLLDPIWAMLAIAVSVTAIFINSLWGRPSLFNAIFSVGRPPVDAARQTSEPALARRPHRGVGVEKRVDSRFRRAEPVPESPCWLRAQDDDWHAASSVIHDGLGPFEK
jgi:hypothetical protein